MAYTAQPRDDSSVGSASKEKVIDNEPEAHEVAHATSGEEQVGRYSKFKPYILGGLALLILGWWISATILHDTRHRWSVSSIPYH